MLLLVVSRSSGGGGSKSVTPDIDELLRLDLVDGDPSKFSSLQGLHPKNVNSSSLSRISG